MQNFKPKPKELEPLVQAAVCLKAANEALGRAKKEADAAKETLTRWLAGRGVELEGLKLGEMVQIEGVALIEMSKQARFQEGEFLLKHPELHLKFMKDVPVRKFKALV